MMSCNLNNSQHSTSVQTFISQVVTVTNYTTNSVNLFPSAKSICMLYGLLKRVAILERILALLNRSVYPPPVRRENTQIWFT